MFQFFKENYTFLTNYFETAITSNNLSNAIMFCGNDVFAQYYFAMALAKAANCEFDAKENCECLNCKWIKDNKHPEVITVSKVDNKNDDSKTVISLSQIDFVKDNLVSKTQNQRFIIFCDADLEEKNAFLENKFKNYEKVGIKSPYHDDDNRIWVPKGLKKGVFQDVAANSLLKIIEEPPENTTFIFLVNDKSDMLETIVSRCQIFYVPAIKSENIDLKSVKDFFFDYPNFEKSKLLDFANELKSLIKNENVSFKTALDAIQLYFLDLYKENISNKALCNIIKGDIRFLEDAKMQIDVHMKDENVLEQLALNLFIREDKNEF